MNILELLTIVITSTLPQAEPTESSLEITSPQEVFTLSRQERYAYNKLRIEHITEDEETLERPKRPKKEIRINNDQQNKTIKTIKSII